MSLTGCWGYRRVLGLPRICCQKTETIERTARVTTFFVAELRKLAEKLSAQALVIIKYALSVIVGETCDGVIFMTAPMLLSIIALCLTAILIIICHLSTNLHNKSFQICFHGSSGSFYRIQCSLFAFFKLI